MFLSWEENTVRTLLYNLLLFFKFIYVVYFHEQLTSRDLYNFKHNFGLASAQQKCAGKKLIFVYGRIFCAHLRFYKKDVKKLDFISL